MSTRFSADRFVYVFAADRALTSGAGQVLEVYTDAECTTLATITDLDGVPIAGSTLVVGADSQLPLFLDVEDHDRLWVRPPNSSAPGTEILPTLDVLTGLIVTTETAAAVQAYLAANPPEVEPSTDAGNLLALGTDGRLVLTAAALPPVVTDHGTLSGLADDDHPQYLTQVRGDTRYHTKAEVATLLADKADDGHTHAIADTTGLQAALDAKAAAAHVHAIGDTTGLQAALNAKAALTHSHVISDTTGLQAALDAKAASAHTHPISQVTNLQATLDGKAALSHGHEIGHVTGLQAALDGKQPVGNYATVTDLADGLATRAALDHDHGVLYVKTVNTIPPDANGNVTIVAHGGGEGVTDHGELTGLADDDHPQYLTNERGDARYYTQATVDGLLASKVDDDDARLTDARTPVAHTHAVADVTGLQDTLDGLVATSDPRLTDARTPTAHTHAQADVTGLSAALAALSNEVEYTGSSWPARPAIAGTVKYLSTKDAAAPAPTDQQTGDLWFRHPDAA